MRLPEEGKQGGVDSQHEFRYVSRHHATNGRKSNSPSAQALVESFGTGLTSYIEKLPHTLKRLQPIAAKVAGNDNTIVVLVCNFGQSELLFNFVCSARSRDLELSKILLFATDQDISDLATSLGITVFDVQDAFGDMPTAAARAYGDKTFAGTCFLLIVVGYIFTHFAASVFKRQQLISSESRSQSCLWV